MSSENQSVVRKGGRWLRVGLLTYMLAAPFLSALLERLRQRSDALQEQAQELQESVGETQVAALARLDALTTESRQLVEKQAREIARIIKHTAGPLNAMMRRLRKQTKELETLNRQLRKTVRKEAKQRRKYLKQLRKTSSEWSQEVVERSSQLTQDFIERSGKVASDLAERSSKLAQDLTDFSSKATKDLVERSNEATRKLAKQVGAREKKLGELLDTPRLAAAQMTQELAERGDELLKPVRIRSGNGWTIFGFSLGVITAAIVTYILIRRRMVERELEELEQQIELPQNGNLNTGIDMNQNKPVGEIRRVDDIGTAVVMLPVVDVEQMQRPADAKFVGIASIRLYYPVETPVDAKDLVYFVSEEEAQNQGFTAAQSRDEQL